MKLFFITFSAIESGASDVSRLSLELPLLSELCEVHILQLHSKSKIMKEINGNAFFHELDISFAGWSVCNLEKKSKEIVKIIEEIHPDIVILTKEVWDFINSLSLKLKNRYPFAVFLHAMPFLGAPQSVSSNFESDVKKYLDSGLESYKKEYNFKHYKEAKRVFSRFNLIAMTPTVQFYIKNYFPSLTSVLFPPFICLDSIDKKTKNQSYKYDFLYMARMEKGKGIEYLPRILLEIYNIVKRPISIAVAGKVDDVFSQKALEILVQTGKESKKFKVTVLGWLNNKQKKYILNNSKVFLYPSLFDTFSLVLAEALSSSVPSIVWDTLFIQHSYAKIEGVKKVTFPNFKEFGEKAVECIENRKILSDKYFLPSTTFPQLYQLVKLDIKAYKNIIRRFHEKSK